MPCSHFAELYLRLGANPTKSVRLREKKLQIQGEPRGKGSRALHEGTLTGCWNTNIQCGKEEAGGQPDVVAQVYNPNTWEIEEGRS